MSNIFIMINHRKRTTTVYSQMQTKFAALIPKIISGETEINVPSLAESGRKASFVDPFWHSFFLLRPEFLSVQNALSNSPSLQAIHSLIKMCVFTIGDDDPSSIAQLKRANASFLLVQVLESSWPKLRQGTFGVDAVSFLCDFGKPNDDKVFFNALIDSVLNTKKYLEQEPVLLFLSILSATGDVETNALVDFFTERCDDISDFCMCSSDSHLLLLSLLLQIDRPNGAFGSRFRNVIQNSSDKLITFCSLVSNLMSRASYLYLNCRPERKQTFLSMLGFGTQTKNKTSVIKLGYFFPTKFQLPLYFSLFEPFVDASILCFYEIITNINKERLDISLLSASLSLLSYVITSSSTHHSGDRLKMILLAFSFLFDNHVNSVSLPFDFTQFQSCFNTLICECRESSIGSMALDLISILLEKKPPVYPISPLIGRILYQILYNMTSCRGNHHVNWKRFFDRVFSFCNKIKNQECIFNGFVLAIISLCSSFRTALFKKDDGYIQLLISLSKYPGICFCSYTAPSAFSNSNLFMKKCLSHANNLSNILSEIQEKEETQIAKILNEFNIESIQPDNFPNITPQTERPKYDGFLHIFSRQHCENIQILLQYTISHL